MKYFGLSAENSRLKTKSRSNVAHFENEDFFGNFFSNPLILFPSQQKIYGPKLWILEVGSEVMANFLWTDHLLTSRH